MKNNEILKSIKHLESSDAVMKRIINDIGPLRMKPDGSIYTGLIRAVIAQQLSSRAADTIEKRFAEKFPGYDSRAILDATEEELRSPGLSRMKAKYIRGIAERYAEGEPDGEAVGKTDDETLINELTAIKGIGRWTAQMVLIFNLGRMNVLPTGDLGIRKAVQLNYGLAELPSEEGVLEISERNNWSPYNSVASWYLWQTLS